MEKEFIPYEESIALKALSFDIPCIKGFFNKEEIFTSVSTPVDFNNKKQLGELISCPTFSQAFKWFREKHGYYHEIFVDDDKTFGFMISYFVKIGRGDKPIQRKYSTYKETELECLKKLIEIIKNKQNE
jgi:hypothetical protein